MNNQSGRGLGRGQAIRSWACALGLLALARWVVVEGILVEVASFIGEALSTFAVAFTHERPAFGVAVAGWILFFGHCK